MAQNTTRTTPLLDGSGCFKTLLDNGYVPVPIVPFNQEFHTREGKTRQGGKVPGEFHVSTGLWGGFPGWQSLLEHKPSLKQISRWESWSIGGRPNAGILTGNIVAIDIDILDKEIAARAHALAFSMLGETELVRYGEAPKRLLLYRLDNGLVMGKLKSTVWRAENEGAAPLAIEVLGKGQQFVAFGTHPKTKQPYLWAGASPLDITADQVTLTTRAALAGFLSAFDMMMDMEGYIGARKQLDATETAPKSPSALVDTMGYIADAIRCLPATLADDYHEWIRIGHAIKAAVPDASLALELWHEFSEKSELYDPIIADEKWRDFKPTSIGAGSIYRAAAEHGWQPSEAVIKSGDFETSLPASDYPRMRMITKIEPLELAPRQWVLGHYLLRGQVTTLVAPGGVGKSTLTLAWAASIAAKKNLVAAVPHVAGNTWVINNEDDHDELLRRYLAVKLGFNLDWSELENKVFFTGGAANPFIIARRTGGAVVPGEDFNWAVACARERNITAIFIDPLVETHSVDENDNSQMQQVIALYRRLAQEANCAVCLVHHTSKPPGGSSEGFAGNANAGRGASAVVNTARVGLTLFDMSIQDAKRYGIAEHVRNRYVRLDDAKVNLSLRSASAKWMYRESIAIGNGDELGVLKPVALVDRDITLGDDLLERIFEIMEPVEEISLVDLTREILSDPIYHDEKEPTLRRRIREQLLTAQSNCNFTIQYARKDANKVKEWVKKIVTDETSVSLSKP